MGITTSCMMWGKGRGLSRSNRAKALSVMWEVEWGSGTESCSWRMSPRIC